MSRINEGRSITPYSRTRNVGGVNTFLHFHPHELLSSKEIKPLAFTGMDYRKTIGRRIAHARENKGWTLKELSTKTGGALDPNRISNYETGFRLPKPPEIATLAKALGVRPAYLMALDDVQIPITTQEESLIKNWRTLPERERMELFRRVEALAMTYRDPVADQKVERSLGTPTKPRTHAK